MDVPSILLTDGRLDPVRAIRELYVCATTYEKALALTPARADAAYHRSIISIFEQIPRATDILFQSPILQDTTRQLFVRLMLEAAEVGWGPKNDPAFTYCAQQGLQHLWRLIGQDASFVREIFSEYEKIRALPSERRPGGSELMMLRLHSERNGVAPYERVRAFVTEELGVNLDEKSEAGASKCTATAPVVRTGTTPDTWKPPTNHLEEIGKEFKTLGAGLAKY